MDKYSFNSSESLAVARLIRMVLFFDDSVDRQESDFFEEVLQTLNISSEKFESSLPEPVESSYNIVKAMSAEKRRQCGQLLRLAVGSDKVVELSGLSRLNEILEKAEIFRPDEENKDEGFL